MPRRISEQQKLRQMMGSTSATIGVKRKPKDRLQLLKDFKKIKQNYAEAQNQSQTPPTSNSTENHAVSSQPAASENKILGAKTSTKTSSSLQTNYTKKAELTTS